MNLSSKNKTSSTGLLKTLGQGVVAFFRNDIELRRDPSGVKVVLQAQPPKPGKREAQQQVAVKRESEELQLMRRQLATLLDELPDTRRTLKHLVFVEQAIAKRGLKALQRVPVDVLEKALAQLESLVTNWSPVGLASLRSKMAVAVIEREHSDDDDAAGVNADRPESVLDSMLPEELLGTELEGHDEDALAAAYAALGDLAPVAPAEVELQSELRSPSARGVGRDAARAVSNSLPPVEQIPLRSLSS